MEKARLRQILTKFSAQKVLVLGDLMLDEYVWGKVGRISPEAPVPVVEVKRHEFRPGGAGNVANNVIALGGKVWVGGVVGEDEAGRMLVNQLCQLGADVGGIFVDAKRPTTKKLRVIARHQQVVRVDNESRQKIDDEMGKLILGYFDRIKKQINGVIAIDYDKGVIVPGLLSSLISGSEGILFAAGPKPANIQSFKGADIIVLNQREASAVVGFEIVDLAGVERGGGELLRVLGNSAVVITREEHGMSVFSDDGKIEHIPAVVSEVYDVAGAGDTVVSVFTLAVLSGASLVEAAKIANLAAGVVVRKVGVATAGREEIESLLG